MPHLAHLVAPALGLPADMTLALVLALAAPPSTGTAALAWMLGLDGTLALVVTMIATVATPLTVAMLAPFMDGLSIDPAALAGRLALLIGIATGLALLLRRHASVAVRRLRPAVDVLSLVSLFIFAVASMAGVQARIVAEPLVALAYVGLAFGMNIGLTLMGAALPDRFERRWAVGLVLGCRNAGLIWSVLGSSLTPSIALYFAATQFPIYMLPRLFQMVLPVLRRGSLSCGQRA